MSNNFEQFLFENILNPKAQKYLDDAISSAGKKGYREHDKVFGDEHDMVIPLEKEGIHREIDPDKIPDEVKNTLTKHGYGIKDYLGNVATKTRRTPSGDTKEDNPSISKILAREKDKTALEKFNNDPQRQSKLATEHEIVISRDPQKVGRMTSSRRWCGEHCTRLPGPEMVHPDRTKHISDEDMENGGLFHHKIEDDIKHGTLIAYLVKKGDHNVEAPLGRILIKKHNAFDGKGNPVKGRSIYRPELGHAFGASPDNFKATVQNWSETHYPSLKEGEKALVYKKEPELYDDEEDKSTFVARTKGTFKLKDKVIHVNEKGKLHDKEDGTAAKITTNPFISETHEHFKNGIAHRDDDKPQEIHHEFTDDGWKVTKQVWRQNGLIHRDGDKPAHVVNDGRSLRKSETYMKFGLPHRNYEDGPAEIYKSSHRYVMNGVEHRPSSHGPSYVDKYGDHRYMEYGKLVRPANGAPSKSEGMTHRWEGDDHNPSVVYNERSNKLTAYHSNGDIHRYDIGAGTASKMNDDGANTSNMSQEDREFVDKHLNGLKNKPQFPA